MCARNSLACVLMADAETSLEDLVRMVQLGAVEIIQKPLSQERLQNIWQHVVRKVSWCHSGLYQGLLGFTKTGWGEQLLFREVGLGICHVKTFVLNFVFAAADADERWKQAA